MVNTISKTIENNEVSQNHHYLNLRERFLSRWLRHIEVGHLTVEFPSGRRSQFRGEKDGPDAFIKINDLRLFFRIAAAGDLGLAESYMKGEWETTDLSKLLQSGAVNAHVFARSLQPNMFVKMFLRFYHAHRQNSRNGSRRNIAAHYDLGNTFYEHWLDPSMSYSSAVFDDFAEDMEVGQRRKYLKLATSIDLKPGDRVLEIGCGWGGFAEIAAAEFGCHVTCLTLSKEQAVYARQRMANKGLSDQIDIRIQDYRDVEGTYDKIVSIEMFEAVGVAYWDTYLSILRQRLKPGGKAALQIITIDDASFESYRRNPDFIQRYIFPGGMLPSPKVFEKAVNAAHLRVSETSFYGKSYGETVRRWDQNFQASWPDIKPLGFDQTFYRMWRYYLCYCETGFDNGTIDVGQFVIEAK